MVTEIIKCKDGYILGTPIGNHDIRELHVILKNNKVIDFEGVYFIRKNEKEILNGLGIEVPEDCLESEIILHTEGDPYCECQICLEDQEIPKRPEYDRCNKGHLLKWDVDRKVWDCPICIEEMKILRENQANHGNN